LSIGRIFARHGFESSTAFGQSTKQTRRITMAMNTILMGGAAALVALTFIPFTFPNTAHVQRTAVIPAEPGTLFKLIASNDGYQTFNPYKSIDPNLKISLYGPQSGIGSGFTFDGKDGKGSQTIASLETNKSVTMAIDLGSMGKPTQTFNLEPTANGTKVIWSMDMDLGMNPLKRVFGLFMDRMIGGTFDQGLANLSKAVAKSA
jgi:hypothetical protein